MILAQRLASGMKEAYESAQRTSIDGAKIQFDTAPVKLPAAEHLVEKEIIAKLKSIPARGYISLADQLAWLERVKSGHSIDIGCLRVGNVRMLTMPGELFVEYQLQAKAMRRDLKVMMAAYGDYGPGYIGTAKAYKEGGYEVSPTSSSVSSEAEPILIGAIQKLLAP